MLLNEHRYVPSNDPYIWCMEACRAKGHCPIAVLPDMALRVGSVALARALKFKCRVAIDIALSLADVVSADECAVCTVLCAGSLVTRPTSTYIHSYSLSYYVSIRTPSL